MVKVRMNTADVAAEVKCLRRLIGMRCANVYDISPKTYLFKLMNSSGITESGESEKVLLLMESGVRLHTTAYVRDKNTTPSGFTLKLRKHIRTRRLEDVRQLGYDRIILFQFGLGTNAHYIILELYSQGNLLLTDSEFVVMTLLRSHRDDDKGLAIMSRHRYPVETCRVFERTTFEKLKLALSSSCGCEGGESLATGGPSSSNGQTLHQTDKSSELNKGKNDVGRSNKSTLKVTLGEVLGYGPALSEHIILDAGLVPNWRTDGENKKKLEDNMLQSLAEAVARFEDWLTDIMSGQKIPEGYILMRVESSKKKDAMSFQETDSTKVYDEFCPILLNQLKSREFMKLETFDAALDEFYSKIESQKAEQQQKSREGAALQKLDKIRSDQENRVYMLKKEVDHCNKMAELIEYNLEDVDSAILAVRVALANGMNWEGLARMVKEEKKSGNPVAGLIDKLNLERNCITLLLSNNLDEMDEDEKTRPVDKVEVDLALSAHANARRWYELKKKQESKQGKTITAHDKAFKAAERKTRLQLAQEKVVAAITHMRKVHWFEKFNWFITSENYLVISGRDAQQNEMIVKRYMSKGDLYVHADLHGASSTVIKNHKMDQPVSPLSLNQAGCYTVCQSQAWDSKIVTSAWWVYPHQVSKTAPTGEYLTVGSFMIRGKKNFLPPQPLVMGFGILFRLDESSMANHVNERRVRGEDEGSLDVKDDDIKSETGSEHGESTDSEITDGGVKSDLHFKLTNDSSNCSGVNSNNGSPGDPAILPSDSCIRVEDDKLDVHLDRRSSIVNENSEPSISAELEVLIDRALEVGPAKGFVKRHVAGATDHILDDSVTDASKGAVRDKPYISKAERRKLKKGQKDTNDITLPKVEQHKQNNKQDVLPVKNAGNVGSSVSKLTRGQKGKLKKIKEKYAEQDDEERNIRMALLASAGKSVKKEAESKDKDEPFLRDVQSEQVESSSKICYKCKKPGHLSKDCQEHMGIQEEGKGVSTKPIYSNNPDEVDKIFIADDPQELGEDEKAKLNDLDCLTGIPLQNDILLYAVPVCGPYNALQTYKFRVKITPGAAKKGKAAKTAMSLFSHMPEATSREKELLKACTEPELVAAIIGNARVTAPGLTQLKQKQKKTKKLNREK